MFRLSRFVAMVLVLVFFVAQIRFGRDHEGGSGRTRARARQIARSLVNSFTSMMLESHLDERVSSFLISHNSDWIG